MMIISSYLAPLVALAATVTGMICWQQARAGAAAWKQRQPAPARSVPDDAPGRLFTHR